MIEKTSLNNSFGYFGDDRKIGNYTVVGEVFFIERGFFYRSGVTKEDVNGGWKGACGKRKVDNIADGG